MLHLIFKKMVHSRFGHLNWMKLKMSFASVCNERFVLGKTVKLLPASFMALATSNSSFFNTSQSSLHDKSWGLSSSIHEVQITVFQEKEAKKFWGNYKEIQIKLKALLNIMEKTAFLKSPRPSFFLLGNSKGQPGSIGVRVWRALVVLKAIISR